MTPSSPLALLGTGLLGGAIAERLQTTGHSVIAYNRTSAKALPLQALGIAVASDPETAVTEADPVLLVLADAAAIRSVLFSPRCAAVLRGKTVVQMGTIASAESLALQQDVERHGGTYCEAPVLGSLAEAKAGTLLVVVGATPDQFARLDPLFRSLGREPRLVGPVGKAATLKLALNQLIAAEISAFALSLGLISRSRISVDTFMTILRESALFAPTFDKKLPRLLARDYSRPNFSARHMLKDVSLVAAEADRCGIPTDTLDGLRRLLENVIARGLGDGDYSALYEMINPNGKATNA